MNIHILWCASLLLFAGCTKVADTVRTESSTSAPAQNSLLKQYTIRQGQHYCDQNAFKTVETAELKFIVRFDSSAIYQTKVTENQYDINKLYGFSDNGAQHHQFSARFGWRWSDGALRLFAYVYNSGKMTSKELTTVDIGSEVVCTISVTQDSYLFTVNDKVERMPRHSTTPLAKGYLLYPYFGGDETAPHAMSVWIRLL